MKRVKPREKIMQRGIGFHFRQMEFFNWCYENDIAFSPDEHCRKITDEQIKLMGDIYPKVKQFLEDEK